MGLGTPKIKMKNLIDALKISFGRKLSQEDIERAKKGEQKTYYPFAKPNVHLGDFLNIYFDGAEIIKREVFYGLRVVDGASRFCWEREEVREYDSEGLLSRLNIFTPDVINGSEKKIVIYNPHGRFKGERVK